VFAQAEVNVTPSTLITAGASLNFIQYVITDMRATTTTPVYLNQSGSKTFTPILTPRLAVTQKITDEISAYASFSQGFSPPGTNQIIITQIGQVNLDLMPEMATSYEIGSKGSLFNKALNYEIAYFMMPVTNKLVPQNFPAANGLPAYSITTNVGQVQQNGLEVSASYALRFDDESSFVTLIRPFAAYTLSDFRYASFKSDNNNNAATVDFSGLRLVGVAPNLFNGGVDVETRIGAYLNTTAMYVDAMPITNNNRFIAESYTLVNARAGWRGKLGDNFNLEVYGGADNILGAKYSPQVFLNLTAAAGQPLPLFFNPGPKITFYGGLVLKYSF
jgi:iron complex outermembrane receptor protein